MDALEGWKVVGVVSAGFPSPAEGFEDPELDLHDYLVTRREATYFFRAAGHSMKDEGIPDGAVVVVDRSVTPKPGRLAVVEGDGGFQIARLTRAPSTVFGVIVASVVKF
ncbi:LexA family protein [Mucisphaera sp.]|uniref:LexA family protein n=1 Tax=Mucisphaera sp. TaxID=2913024 RepID=UPI003D09C912